ncbi:phosphonate ABC transporter, permease protein PhnE [Alkalimonas amylolytica]|uniref:Phosphonate transport system permease protein n=1 Tax=Alkalimonas amylolytica TaxID=152573 RepID=A0A1H4DYW9_ALKAM|nr:phosphonate ABC transporter, permease protein PhnE [Alkalimonas amylolytica]SEA77951.1 phosphonate transport system permease protein [Alkalimonas amylolytica]
MIEKAQHGNSDYLPPRFRSPSVTAWLLIIGFVAFFLHGIDGADVSIDRLGQGILNVGIFAAESFPPDLSRWNFIAYAMLETFQMALVGVVFGVIISVPFALLSARNTSPNRLVRWLSTNIVATLRTIPDLVWALIFVVAVGLGPLAGILAIMMDTIGFCGRFFAERIEETDPRPAQALTAAGCSRSAVIMASILPEAFPSFVATSLYSVEKAIRSAVVLGLVGAGGIGVELSAAMNLFRYDQALTIMLIILLVVISVEHLSSWIRKRLLS